MMRLRDHLTDREALALLLIALGAMLLSQCRGLHEPAAVDPSTIQEPPGLPAPRAVRLVPVQEAPPGYPVWGTFRARSGFDQVPARAGSSISKSWGTEWLEVYGY